MGPATSTSTTRSRGVFRLDRVLSSAVFYNFDYGFIEGTRAGDGDHTDALLIIDEPTFTGCHVWARPIGGLEMRDEKGFDFKVLCVAIGDAHQQHIERLEQVRPHRLVEIEHFFQTYKALEDKDVDVVGWRDARAGARGPARRTATAWERETGPAVRVTAAGRRPRWPGADLPGRRLFIAVPLPSEASAAIAGLVGPVRAEGVPGGGRDVRWVRLDGLHLTLRFLGPTLEDRVDAATAAVRAAAAASQPPSTSSIGGAGAFPSPGRPRALWLGIRTGADELVELARRRRRGARRGRLDRRAAPVPPHLTLARSDGVAGRRGHRATPGDRGGGLDVRFRADRIGLFESLTGGGPARYEPIELVRLGWTGAPGSGCVTRCYHRTRGRLG